MHRAVLEATGSGVRHNIQAIEAADGDVRRVVAVGGGVQGGPWAQVVSDVSQRPQELRTVSIGAGYGGAFLAARLVSAADIDSWNPVRAVVAPRPKTAERYDHLYDLYQRLYRSSSDVVHQLAALQSR